MRSAAAQIFFERPANRGVCRIGVAVEEDLRGHDHSIDAISALRSLRLDERRLNRVRPRRSAQAFEGGDLLSSHLINTNRAGTDRLSLHDYGASSALAQATAKLWSVQPEI